MSDSPTNTTACRVCELEWIPDRLDETGLCVNCVAEGATTPPEMKAVWRSEECSMCHGEGVLHFRDEVPR